MRFWTLEILGFIWALPVTLLGFTLLCVMAMTGNVERGHHVRGIRVWIELKSMWFLRERFRAMCLGSFVFVRDIELVADTKMLRGKVTFLSEIDRQLYLHEDEHRRQCWILGGFVIPLYLLFTLLALTLYRKYYRANYLEIVARWKAGQGLEP